MKRIAVLLAALGLSPSALAATSPALNPNPSHFGDLVTATLPSSAATPDFGPFSIRSKRSARGRTTYVLQCTSVACLPGATPRRLMIPPVVILARATAAEAAQPAASFRRDTELPAPRYRFDLALTRLFLFAAAAALAGLGVSALRPRSRQAQRSTLERAIALVRASAARSAEDRRRAIDLLDRSLPGSDLAALAWSAPPPTPTAALDVAEAAEGDT